MIRGNLSKNPQKSCLSACRLSRSRWSSPSAPGTPVATTARLAFLQRHIGASSQSRQYNSGGPAAWPGREARPPRPPRPEGDVNTGFARPPSRAPPGYGNNIPSRAPPGYGSPPARAPDYGNAPRAAPGYGNAPRAVPGYGTAPSRAPPGYGNAPSRGPSGFGSGPPTRTPPTLGNSAGFGAKGQGADREWGLLNLRPKGLPRQDPSSRPPPRANDTYSQLANMLSSEPSSGRPQRPSNAAFGGKYSRTPTSPSYDNPRGGGFNPYERSRVSSPRDGLQSDFVNDNRIGRNTDNRFAQNTSRFDSRFDNRQKPTVRTAEPAAAAKAESPEDVDGELEIAGLDPIAMAIAAEDAPFDEYDQRRKPKKDMNKGGETKEDIDYRAKDKARAKANKSGKLRRRNHDDEMDDIGAMIDRRRKQKSKRKEAEAVAPAAIPIVLPQFISVSNLGKSLRVKLDVFLDQLAELGFEDITPDSIMTGETAALVAQEYGYEPTLDVGENIDLKARPAPADVSVLPERPPIVTIMGHVDHGKTTMLDWLRKSSVVSQEHGGITQHIGAFSVKMSNGKQITFLDTPGHAAFLTMRQRGANVTDIIVLVVAADDSVKPQTLEALKHARGANVPIIVAINKVDKDEARVDNVKADLARHGVDIEDFGGDVQVVCVSGRTGLGMDDLEEAVLTLSEILDVRAEDDGLAEGWVLESSVKPVGRAATVLVKRGTLRKGDIIAAGTTWAKVRLLRNEAGTEIDEAPPGTPVEILGWRELPDAGDEVLQAPDQARAKEAIAHRIDVKERQKAMTEREAQEVREREKAQQEEELTASLAFTTGRKTRRQREEEAAAKAAAVQAAKEREEEERNKGPVMVNFAVKGDVMGSVEAVCASIQEIGNNEVLPRILASSPGAVTEWDIEHATVTKSTIVNFNLPLPGAIKKMAADAGVQILDYNVIYHLTDRIKEQLSVHLAPKITYRVLGEAEVLQLFPINVVGRVFRNVAGCRVRTGQLMSKYAYRVYRGNEKVFEGKLETLKQGKKDATEIHKGGECGISFLDWDEIEAGDKIQAYEEIREERNL